MPLARRSIAPVPIAPKRNKGFDRRIGMKLGIIFGIDHCTQIKDKFLRFFTREYGNILSVIFFQELRSHVIEERSMGLFFSNECIDEFFKKEFGLYRIHLRGMDGAVV